MTGIVVNDKFYKQSRLYFQDIECKRGITIFAKQVDCQIGTRRFTLIDTLGHSDLSAEMECTLQVPKTDCSGRTGISNSDISGNRMYATVSNGNNSNGSFNLADSEAFWQFRKVSL